MNLCDVEDLISRGREIRGSRPLIDIAYRLGVYPSTVMRWENGTEPAIGIGLRYAQVLYELQTELQ